jgi:hypothetical protein
MRRRRKDRRAAVAALALLALAGCGGSGNTKEEKAFVTAANARCYNTLSPVREAADATKTNAPRDDVIAQAQTALSTAADNLDAMNAPASKRQVQAAVSGAMRSSSRAMGQYLQDKQSNEPATSGDWNNIVQQLSQLQQISYGDGIRACSIPVQ